MEREVSTLFAAAVLLCAAATALRRSGGSAFWIGAGGLALAAAALWHGWRSGEWVAALAAALPALATKALLVPAALGRFGSCGNVARPSPAANAAAVAGIAAGAAWTVLPALGGTAAAARPGLAIALAVLGIGAWLLWSRRDLDGIAAGAAAMDNGLVLALLALPSWPAPVAALFPVSALLALLIPAGFAAMHRPDGAAALRGLFAAPASAPEDSP